MSRINLKSTNRRMSILTTFLTILFGIITFIIPSLLINFIPHSAIGNFFINNAYYTYAILPIIFYIIITGFYYYSIKIDIYIMYITSYRTISGLLKARNYIEVPHDMLRYYSFFNRPLTFNKTLMLKISDVNGKRIIKRFNISFLSQSEELRISKVLDQIIAKNRK
tara:strand:- start:4 stop:501 length:498 start_codon:yes stop_codon:yes gene_type:complete